jgi:hypothetical protein
VSFFFLDMLARVQLCHVAKYFLFVFPLFTELFCSFFQFMDLTSLQDTLPDLHTTTDYSGSLAQSWVSQNSTMPYVPSGPQGICLLHQINHHAQVRKRGNTENLALNAKPDSFFFLKKYQEDYPTCLDKTLTCCKLLEPVLAIGNRYHFLNNYLLQELDTRTFST